MLTIHNPASVKSSSVKLLNFAVPYLIIDAASSTLGYDGIEMAKVLGISTHEQNKTALGSIAARKLIEQIENHNNNKEHIIVTGRLLEGNTVKKIK